jgi:CheY-like chemotaxis protein
MSSMAPPDQKPPPDTAAAAAHEINNALVYLTLGLEMIERELLRMEKAATAEDWERLRGYCKETIAGAERIGAIVRDLRASSRQAEKPAAPVAVEPARRPRLLLIDDEPRLGLTLSAGLRHHVDVVSVLGGREAIALLGRGESFDLILCDLTMPDLTGMDVFEQVVRSRPELRRRFVFTTGGAVTERARQFLEAMPDQRLDKPFRLEQVEALLRDHPR